MFFVLRIGCGTEIVHCVRGEPDCTECRPTQSVEQGESGAILRTCGVRGSGVRANLPAGMCPYLRLQPLLFRPELGTSLTLSVNTTLIHQLLSLFYGTPAVRLALLKWPSSPLTSSLLLE